MSTTLMRTLTAAFALPLVLGLAACSGTSAKESGDRGTEEALVTEGATTAAEPTTGTDDSADADDVTIAVESEGDGPIGLRTSTDPKESAEPVSGKLITGSGGCFALVETDEADDDRPSLLVFTDDASFTLRTGKPSVTTDALGTVTVGSTLTAQAVDVDAEDTTGIPDRCLHGDVEVLLVTGK